MPALAGQRVVVTRAVNQAEELAEPLRERGAQVILLPTIAIVSPSDPAPLREAAAHCDAYDWILFSSANAVAAFAAELRGPRNLRRARIAAIGSATRESAEKEGFTVSLVPEKFVAESLVEAFASENLYGCRVLIPSSAVTREILPNELRRRGATVDVVEAYRNIIPPDTADLATAVFREPYPDWVTFTSSSAVDNLLSVTVTTMLIEVKIATIGPVTSDSVRKHGLDVAAEADPHTVSGLVEALCNAPESRAL
ncbi:MAG: uroporphyrinogen-III synthase [Acidobacteriaceae bacterium]|nr:uroporphyrinogen-III synthase [Acidobacteriaceae bacterium]